jgi:hypothetical protein
MMDRDDAFADILRTLDDRLIKLDQNATKTLRGLFDETIGPFLDYMEEETGGVDVWKDPRFMKFPRFILGLVTYAIAAEARQIARATSYPSAPVNADVIRTAAINVMQRPAIRDACAYHINDMTRTLRIPDTKACGPYFIPG